MPRTTPLKLALLDRQISQVEFAKRTGIPATVLNTIVNGWRIPTDTQAKQIAKLLRKRVRALFDATVPDP